MIGSMDFCRVVSAKKLKGSGLSMGDVVMVLGTKYVPASAKDPYLSRMLVTVTRLVDDLPIIPKKGDDEYVWIVDPRSLEKVNEEEMEYYTKTLEERYTNG